MALQRVLIESDDDGHDYVIPYEMGKEFEKLLRNGHKDDYEAFNDKFSEYMIGGHISLIKLYADFSDLKAK
jgi:hypothetical protein